MSISLPASNYSSESFGNSHEFPGIINGQRVLTGDHTDIEELMYKILREGDYAAFQQLFKKMYGPLCQFCVKFVHVKEVAEELVSDVFYNIWKNRQRIIVTSPKAYLFTAVRNRGFDHLRKVKKSVWCDLEEATHIPADSTDSQDILVHYELNKSLEQSIASLPKQCRLIFELSRDHGMKYKEIASMLNISIKTVETQMGRALKHLRQSLPAM
jgi:RNA polymerase sigma-70 factor (ECF subfamily)